jgi:hypothetical protein
MNKNRIGEVYKTFYGEKIEIVRYGGSKDCDVKFENGFVKTKLPFDSIKSGYIKNPYRKSIYGVGFVGEGNYKYKHAGGGLKSVLCWNTMLRRCYDSVLHKKRPTYKDVTVCEEWHNFQNFAKWFDESYNPETMKGWHLDKDILVQGNRIYSPETCCFVPQEINSAFSIKKVPSSCNTPGISMEGAKYKVRCRIEGKEVCFGNFEKEEDAFYTYREAKLREIKRLADFWKGQIEDKVYKAMYNWIIEITK